MEILFLLLSTHGLYISLKIQRIELENKGQNYNEAL